MKEIHRRQFIRGFAGAGICLGAGGLLAACASTNSDSVNGKTGSEDLSGQQPEQQTGQQTAQQSPAPDALPSVSDTSALPPLPPANPNPDDQFGVDLNININTIDDWLNRADVVYRDVRLLFDEARFASIGGKSELTSTITGFRVVPFPFIGSLQQLPVEGGYTGDCLYNIQWSETGTIISALARYHESQLVLEDLFPRERAIFLMCGGAGYSAMLKSLLVYLGWPSERIYNIGANWSYAGPNTLDLVVEQNGRSLFATWRANYALIDFKLLQPLE